MKVKEAIEELSKMDGEMEIIFSTEEVTYDANFMIYIEIHPTIYYDGKEFKSIPPFQPFVKVI